MTNDQFKEILYPWLETGVKSLLDTLPSGSGIFRIVPVHPSLYSVEYVSKQPGSYKETGYSGNWYGTDLSVSLAETHSTGDCIYEVSRLFQDTPVANMQGLPSQLQDAIYADRELPTGSFEKSHIVLSGLAVNLSPDLYSGIYFPTRRGNGGCVVINRKLVPIQTYYTGSQPPTIVDLQGL